MTKTQIETARVKRSQGSVASPLREIAEREDASLGRWQYIAGGGRKVLLVYEYEVLEADDAA